MSDSTASAVRSTSRGGFIWGILTIILGMLAIASPLFSGLAVATLVGIFLFAAGIAQTIFAFKADSFGEGLVVFLFGLFGILAGLFMFVQPLAGLASITMVLTFYFFADGIFGIFNALRLRPLKGSGWMLFSAIMSIVLGIMIVSDWPNSGIWLIGTLVGVRLLFAGWSMIALGGAGEAVADEIEGR